jgi:ribosome biogenesis protein Nip4
MGIELVNPIDWDYITQQIDIEFGEGVTKALLGDRVPVMMTKEKSSTFYAVPMDWMTRLNEVSEELDFQFIGKELGFLEKGRFRLSLQVLSELAKITHSFIIVSQHGAEAFTYGRSIIRESVLELNPSLVRGQRLLVLNEGRECLGIAALSVDAAKLSRLGADRLVAKNLVDVGWFLRRLG